MAKKKAYSGFNNKTMEHLLLDAGAFFKNFNYGGEGEDKNFFHTILS